MSEESSTSESETSACSSKYDAMKALYSGKTKVPIKNAPMYDNMQQFEAALTNASNVIPVGEVELVRKRKEERERKKLELERELEEKNRQRYAQYEGMVQARPPRKKVNVLTRIQNTIGPLAALKHCVDSRLRVKVITRKDTGVRGELYANLLAYDKQWNLVLTDVLEVWRRKGVKKRKFPPALGVPVEKGTAAAISPVPVVTETPLGGGVWECTRHMPQIMVRGEHVVLVNIVD